MMMMKMVMTMTMTTTTTAATTTMTMTMTMMMMKSSWHDDSFVYVRTFHRPREKPRSVLCSISSINSGSLNIYSNNLY